MIGREALTFIFVLGIAISLCIIISAVFVLKDL